MARSKSTYAVAPYGLADMAFCKFVAELEACEGIRSDVRRNCVVVSVAALTRVWPSSHFSKRERDKWTHKATASFRVSETELAEVAGTSRARVHTALMAMLDHGFIVELAPLTHRGEGRGTTPPTYALRCHLTQTTSPAKSNSGSGSGSGSEGSDRPQPVQAWEL